MIETELDTTGITVESLESAGTDLPPTGEAPAQDTGLVDGRLMNPLTGALCDTNDLDELLLEIDAVRGQLADLQAFHRTLRDIAGSRAEGTTKTRRQRGKTVRARVEMPDIKWDNSILKEAWQSYPQFREDMLRISGVSVQLREYKKTEELQTDDKAYESFVNMVRAANKGPQGQPRVIIEKKPGAGGEARMGCTDKAARIVDEDGESHWIPWSCIEECCELQMRGDCGTLIVEKWLARKENMI